MATVPRTRQPSIRSFIRLRHRRKVDFPHPDGPIRARTDFSRTDSSTSQRACLLGYQKLTASQWNLGLSRVRSPDSSGRRLVKMAEYSRDTTHPRAGLPGTVVLVRGCEET